MIETRGGNWCKLEWPLQVVYSVFSPVNIFFLSVLEARGGNCNLVGAGGMAIAGIFFIFSLLTIFFLFSV